MLDIGSSDTIIKRFAAISFGVGDSKDEAAAGSGATTARVRESLRLLRPKVIARSCLSIF
jgi:hypothetical protein